MSLQYSECHEPTESDVSALLACFPDVNPHKPPWPAIQALLVQRGFAGDFANLTAPAIVEALRQTTERTADTKADSRKKTRGNVIPQNKGALRLAKMIRDRWAQEDRRGLPRSTRIEIAREFTGQQDTRAKNLLRLVRRYKLLK
jgi:hypothetical protein